MNPFIKFLSRHWDLIIVIISALIAGWFLFRPGYFSMHDDLQVMRQHQIHQCFIDGQIPCRWVPDMGSGYGYPLFNFYSPLPSYVGMLFVYMGFGYIDTVKILFLVGLVASAITMWLLTKSLTRKPYAAVLAAILYTWAPYHAVDIYVRGALAESWALLWFPLILWTIWRWTQTLNHHRFIPLIALSISGLLLSHNIMSIWFAPVIIIWSITTITIHKHWQLKPLALLSLAAIWSLGLTAFFVIPAMTEKNLVHTEILTSDYFNFRYHFANVNQLFFDRTFEYGGSVWGPDDEMSFQLGWPHWILVVATGIFWLWITIKKRWRSSLILGIFLFIYGASVAMTHSKTIFIWEAIPLLHYTQFPWRVLALSIFSGSLAVGLAVDQFSSRIQVFALTAISIVTIGLNFNYFQPSGYLPNLTDNDKLSGESWDQQRRGAMLDFLPQTVQTYDVTLPESPVIIDPELGRYENFIRRSDNFSVDVFLFSSEPTTVSFAVYDFPIWQLVDWLTNTELPVTHDNDFGLITIELQGEGKHIIQGWFRNTPIRKIGNTITLLSLASLVIWYYTPAYIYKKEAHHPDEASTSEGS